jgi:hypothetical protein
MRSPYNVVASYLVQVISHTEKILCAVSIQHNTTVYTCRDFETHASWKVVFDCAGENIYRGSLCGQNKMYSGSTRDLADLLKQKFYTR